MVFSGNTATSAASVVFESPVTIKSFSITNKTGGAVTINVSVLYGSTNTWISPLDKSVAANDFYEDDKKIVIQPGRQIYISVSGQVDYYFTIE